MNKTFFFIGLLLFTLCSSCKITEKVKHLPDLTGYEEIQPEITKHNDSLFSYKENYLLKNEYGQWELYLSGNALERGMIAGALMDSLMRYQESAFVEKIDELIPSQKKQKRLLGFLSWFNRNIHKYVPNEYQVELYGMAKYMSTDYNYIGPPYLRNLYYHAAHDIGHALVDFSMVECTSTSLLRTKTEDGKMLLGRNLDFYLSDRFGENKLILFVNPDEGIPFASVSWPGMMGVVSGMNKEGLTVTMNAGSSNMPLQAKEPISILARDILEHASTTEEAIAIAEKSSVFVAEALMVSSAKEKKTVIIEISPKKMGVYEMEGDELVCANHFQSDVYQKDKKNKNRIATSHSLYRYIRMQELIGQSSPITPDKMAAILRNKEGLGDLPLGYGNEKAINQLLSHHGVIFKPEDQLLWVSSAPYVLGAFTAYDLNSIFSSSHKQLISQKIDSLTIATDEFYYSKEYQQYEEFRKLSKRIDQLLDDKKAAINFALLEEYINSNPNFWEVYYKCGLLYERVGEYKKARATYQKAQTKEITTLEDCQNVEKRLLKVEKKVK